MFVNSAFLKKDWFLGLAVTLLFLFAYSSELSVIRSLEFATYDAGVSASALPADDRIVILDIDDQSIELIGRWPWSRTIMADMIDTLTEAGVRMIGVDVFYSEKQASNTDNSSMKLATFLQENGDALLAEAEALANAGNQAAADAKFDEADKKYSAAEEVIAEAEANNGDARLVKATREAGNVFMPMFYEGGEPFGRPDEALPDYVNRMGIGNIGDVDETAPPLSAVKFSYPFAELAQVATGLGYLNVSPSTDDGVLRSEPLIVEYYGHFFPSMSLAMVAHDLNLTMDDVRINIGTSV